jgi:2-oxoglutarate ferredoxin oxidoreductase subunit delta
MAYWRMPLDSSEHSITVGKVNILGYRCKGCKYCIEFCPHDVLEESEDFNEKGYRPPYVKIEGKCVNCNFCETICPEFAIFCTELERREMKPEDILKTPEKRRRRPGTGRT